MSSETKQILTTDGIPLEVSLKKAEKKNKIKAFLLVAPLLLFLVITYIFPIGEMFTRSIDDKMITNMLPKTFKSMETCFHRLKCLWKHICDHFVINTSGKHFTNWKNVSNY